MTKEYAALLAQVVPVIALTAAIELRALVQRYERMRTRRLTPEERDGDMTELGDPLVRQIFLAVITWALCLVLPVLAGVEVNALSVVGEHNLSSSSGPLADQVLTNSVGAVFVIPGIEGAIRLWLATTKKRKTIKLKMTGSLIIVAGFVVLPWLLRLVM